MDKDKKIYLEAAKAKQEAGLEFLSSALMSTELLTSSHSAIDDLPGAIEEYTKGKFPLLIQ